MSISRNRTTSPRHSHTSRSNGNLKHLEDKAGNALARAAGKTADKTTGFQSRVLDGIAVAKVRAGHAAKAVRKHAVRADKVIRARPYHAIAVAAGAGLLTGLFVGRRRSNPS